MLATEVTSAPSQVVINPSVQPTASTVGQGNSGNLSFMGYSVMSILLVFANL